MKEEMAVKFIYIYNVLTLMMETGKVIIKWVDEFIKHNKVSNKCILNYKKL